MKTTKPLYFPRWLPPSLALLVINGCTTYGTENPLPESTRVQMPDLRGIWLHQLPSIHGPDLPPTPYVVVVNHDLNLDERGCRVGRVAMFNSDGGRETGSDSRDPFTPDATWCAHSIAGLTIVEQHYTEGEGSLYQHFILQQHPSRICVNLMEHVIWNAVPESARREYGNDRIIILSSDALAALITESAVDLERVTGKCEFEATRLLPR